MFEKEHVSKSHLGILPHMLFSVSVNKYALYIRLSVVSPYTVRLCEAAGGKGDTGILVSYDEFNAFHVLNADLLETGSLL